MKKRTEILIAFLLCLVLLVSVFNEFVAGKIKSNIEKQIEQDLALSKDYGETSARWLEVNEMLQRNLTLALGGLSDRTVEESGKFNKEDFTESDWQYWKNKTVIEFWKQRYDKAWFSLRKALDETNEKRHKQENFVQKNRSWEKLESIMRILQMGLIIITLLLYGKAILAQANRGAQPIS